LYLWARSNVLLDIRNKKSFCSNRLFIHFAKAFSTFRRIIALSFNNNTTNDISILSTFYNSYSFVEDKNLDTEFEIILIDNVTEYTYGFSYNAKQISYEWLYCKNLNTNRKSKILERDTTNITLGSTVKKDCEKNIDAIEKDVLVLSFFNRLNLETTHFKTLYNCIINIFYLKLDFENLVIQETRELSTQFMDSQNSKKLLLNFLNATDFNISDISYKKTKDNVDIFCHHTGENNIQYPIALEEESDGTQKMFFLFFLILGILRTNGTLIIDELNVKLHPLLIKFVIDMFNESKTNAQLVYTTHDTILLDRKYFRRDQIWFTDKNKFGVSNLYSLAEYKVRQDASFEKEYLGGVFGGIPIVKDFDVNEV
jgi:AAA15 family ATPase/GTPase